jgi:hypothetical protein
MFSGVPQGITNPPRPTAEGKEALESTGKLGWAPGTMVLVLVFLAAFATYYFVNWKLLSFVWQVG